MFHSYSSPENRARGNKIITGCIKGIEKTILTVRMGWGKEHPGGCYYSTGSVPVLEFEWWID